MVFATEDGLRNLSRSQHWFIDGTFKLAPKTFDQIFIIRAKTGTGAVTSVYAVIKGKSEPIYRHWIV